MGLGHLDIKKEQFNNELLFSFKNKACGENRIRDLSQSDPSTVAGMSPKVDAGMRKEVTVKKGENPETEQKKQRIEIILC